MSSPPTWMQRFSISARAIAWFLLALGFLIGLPVILVWPKWVFGLVVALALGLAVPVFLIRRHWVWQHEEYSAGRSYVLISIGLLMALVVLLAAPVYYLAHLVDTRPATLPQAILTDGKKTVVFQGISHFGSEPFYQAIVFDLQKALTEGYMLFYEGVQPSPESKTATDWFKNTLAGGEDLSERYKMLANLCELGFQLDYFGPVEADRKVHPDRHLIADVTQLDIYNEYQRLAKADPSFAQAVAKKYKADGSTTMVDKVFDWIAQHLKGSTEGQKYVTGILCRGLVSRAFSNIEPASDPLDPVILDLRNRHLAKQIVTSPADKIYLLYGGAHLPGLMGELRQLNPNWRLVSMKWMPAITAPDHLEGPLKLTPEGNPGP